MQIIMRIRFEKYNNYGIIVIAFKGRDQRVVLKAIIYRELVVGGN